MTQGASSGASNTGSGMAEEVQQKAGQAMGEAKSAAQQVSGQAKEQATSLIETQKDRIAEQLVTVAQALRQTGQGLQEQDQVSVSKYVNRAAEQVERATNYLRASDVHGLVGDTQALAQRRPGVFLASALAVGMAGARFLMSSGQRARQAQSTGGGMQASASYRRDISSTSDEGSYASDMAATDGSNRMAEYGAAGTSYGDIRSPGA